MTLIEQIVIIAIASVATMATRFLPFLIFKSGKPTPKFLTYIGKVLPPAVFGMLVVYCLKNLNVTVAPYGAAELIGVFSVVILHLSFRKMLLSIAGGTVLYVLLVNFVFI